MKVIYIAYCKECPYREWRHALGIYCAIALKPIDDIHTIPDFCPLENDE